MSDYRSHSRRNSNSNSQQHSYSRAFCLLWLWWILRASQTLQTLRSSKNTTNPTILPFDYNVDYSVDYNVDANVNANTNANAARLVGSNFYVAAAAESTASPDRRSRARSRSRSRSLNNYKRYRAYPEYCSDPSAMATRAIPPLPPIDNSSSSSNNNNNNNSTNPEQPQPQRQPRQPHTKLVHVTAIVRHGARTPVHSKNCWKGHWDAPDGIWDCDLKTVLSTRPPPEEERSKSSTTTTSNGNDNDNDNGGTFLVEKRYDAFRGDVLPSPYRNAMNGTCQDGQLLRQGYDQQVANGRHLRDAYVVVASPAPAASGSGSNGGGGGGRAGDPRLGLLDEALLNGTSTSTTAASTANVNANANDNAKRGGSGGGGKNFLEGVLRYRSDDDQRTLASGQVLLRAMLGPEVEHYRKTHNSNGNGNGNGEAAAAPVITHHTADGPRDILSSKRGKTLCSSQKRVIEQSYRSDAYKTFVASDEYKIMEKMVETELEPEGVAFGGIDCLMTSICTDRGLPEVIDDFNNNGSDGNSSSSSSNNNNGDDHYTKTYGPNRFQRLLNYVIQNQSFATRFNDAELSKMDMGPFWAEIMDHIRPVLAARDNENNNNNNDDNNPPPPPPPLKFALYSGHDSTILPLMASLGEKVWNATDFPPYASMMILEIHEVTTTVGDLNSSSSDFPSGFAFRLIYNGRVLTWLLDGCPAYSHLCDVSVFVDRVTPFATRKNRGCGVEEGEDAEETNTAGKGSQSGSTTTTTTTPAGTTTGHNNGSSGSSSAAVVGVLLLSMVASFVAGSLLTCCVVRCCRWRPRRKQRDESVLVTSNPLGFSSEEADIVID